jgi:DNA repair protein RadD
MKSKPILRPYQEEAIEKGIWSIKKFDNNSLLVLPTGAGKSLVVSGIANELKKEILILQPSKEILQQNMNKLEAHVPKNEIGVYSASFKRKDIRKYNFATIQSIYKKPELFNHIGLVLCDEAHAINSKNKKGMFTSFLKAIGDPIMIGLTATPYRNVQAVGNINGIVTYGTFLKLINRTNPRLWNRISYNINNHELVDQGYLCPLKYFSRTFVPHANIPLNKSASDFNLEEFERLLTPYEEQIIVSINGARKHRKAVLVFCSSVSQAERLATTITKAACVSGKTPTKERDRIIEEFRTGKIQVVFNVGVLTTGFDFPELDCIYLIRPTRSLALYYQMLGRGTRIAEDKEDCYVLDYSGSYDNLGRIEDIKLVKENLWELYANGTKAHGREVFSWTP